MCVCVLYCQITMEGMKSDVDEVANQGIEFWSTVCDEEVDLAIELTEVRHRLIVSSSSCHVVLLACCNSIVGSFRL